MKLFHYNWAELRTIEVYHTNCLRRLMNLPADAAEEAIFFLSSSLPLPALFHIVCLSLFSMICHSNDNVLNKLARITLLTSQSSNKSWFTVVRDICSQYGIQYPLRLLECHLTSRKCKVTYKEKYPQETCLELLPIFLFTISSAWLSSLASATSNLVNSWWKSISD